MGSNETLISKGLRRVEGFGDCLLLRSNETLISKGLKLHAMESAVVMHGFE